MKKIKRKRGAQPGNQNARKHHYYARALNEQERAELKMASSLEGIEEEVALLRALIMKASRSGDYRAIAPLLKALTVLEKLWDIKRKSDIDRVESVRQAVIYLGRILYDGWVKSGRAAPSAPADITEFNESKRTAPAEAKGPETSAGKLLSVSLA